ncbi:winged helix DNA-binding domain-containing protein [uncultured Methanomethylovorans sp.]|uniref:winged helix DNA-binding domain-containing protein n=1 Tax=uncultured Methanomethylovorans sp. TaxID=183759 RepID=UPI002AA72E84|nr:winged helix DNA-binding domain-containing protein [uncultured Methanomethylovorans sp.]
MIDPVKDKDILDIASLRLHNQQITGTLYHTPADLVKHLAALQAQDYAGVKWSVGLRLTESTKVDFDKAIADKTIVRTWLMRGTLHLVAAEDIYWMLELVAPRIIAGSATRHQRLGLDNEIFAHCKDIFIHALSGGKQLTRDEMYKLLEDQNISTVGQRGYHILWWSVLEGLICVGPEDGKQQTFVLLEDWIPKNTILKRDEALAELARRYFTSRGPATLQDFVWWSGLKITDARFGLKAVASQLEQITIDNRTYWMPPNAPQISIKVQKMYLLPGFDEYMLGYKDRSAVLNAQYSQQIVPGNNGMFSSTIVKDGQIVGTWRRSFKNDHIIITPQPFIEFKGSERKLFSVASNQYGQFLEMSVSINDVE